MKRAALVLAVALGLTTALGYGLAPPAARTIPLPPTVVAPLRGALHVHSRRSDGSGTPAEIAAAARSAGLQFVIITDHGDAARMPDPPQYFDGVLLLDAIEISSDGGHIVALGLPRAPYPLAGEPRDVVEDITRLGGMSIAAHPGSLKPELSWRDWTVPVDGVEWLNGDSEWRDESSRTLARTLLTYAFRPPESLAAVLDRPESVLARWDDLARVRRVIGLAAGDAHARLGLSEAGEQSTGPASLLKIPAYEQIFKALSISLPRTTLTGEAAPDAGAIVDAIRRGQVYSTIDALATPAVFDFWAESSAAHAGMGEQVTAGESRRFTATLGGPVDAQMVLLRDGQPLAMATGGPLVHEDDRPGVYRVEVQMPRSPGTPPIPWIVSNPIFVRSLALAPTSDAPLVGSVTPVYEDGGAEDWRVEHSVRSQGMLDVLLALPGRQLRLRYALGGTLSESPYVAAVMPAGTAIASNRAIRFTARSGQPMRLSVQLRSPGNDDAGERWRRSVYLDESSREITVRFDEMRRVSDTSAERPDLANVREVLFVIDTVNTAPGASGQVWLDRVGYVQ